MRLRNLWVVALGLAAVMSLGEMVAIGNTPGDSDEPKAKEIEAAGKGKRAQEFIAAFNKGDAKAVAAFWTVGADYVDQVGHHVKGREAIQKLYEKVFAEQKGAKLQITVTSARLLSPEVALEDGITEVNPADGRPPTVAQFSAVLVKKEGAWYFESVRDSIARPPSNVEHFDDLEWVIGD